MINIFFLNCFNIEINYLFYLFFNFNFFIFEMEDIFMINLKKNFSELYDLANKNEFVILIPNKRLITENMLITFIQ